MLEVFMVSGEVMAKEEKEVWSKQSEGGRGGYSTRVDLFVLQKRYTNSPVSGRRESGR